jgi:hypothetical protein
MNERLKLYTFDNKFDYLYVDCLIIFLPYLLIVIRPLYNDPLSNATNDHVLWVKILHITTTRRLLSNRKLDNK